MLLLLLYYQLSFFHHYYFFLLYHALFFFGIYHCIFFIIFMSIYIIIYLIFFIIYYVKMFFISLGTMVSNVCCFNIISYYFFFVIIFVFFVPCKLISLSFIIVSYISSFASLLYFSSDFLYLISIFFNPFSSILNSCVLFNFVNFLFVMSSIMLGAFFEK